MKNYRENEIQTRFLWFLILAYSMSYVISNWYDPRIISLFGFNTGGGILIFPFTFLLSDLITEVYGYKNARLAIWSGFLFNIVFIIYSYLVTHLPYPSIDQFRTDSFNKLFVLNARIIVASILSYLCSETSSAFIMAKLKIKLNGRYIGIRFISSTIIASGIDSFLFCFLGFYGYIIKDDLLNFILFSWFIKVSIEIIGLPFSIRLSKKLKRLETLDVYDRNTQFNLFILDTSYTKRDNKFYTQK